MTKVTTSRLEKIDIRGMELGEKAIAAIIDGQRIELTTTPCHYGKHRYWFTCPYCHGRVAVLYFGNNGLACRKCYRLAYPIENETKTDRAISQAWKIRNRLDWKAGGIGDFGGCKPKGMHTKTFYKLVAHEQDYARLFFSRIGLWMERKFKIDCSEYQRR